MLPMITVSGRRRLNPRWNQAAGPSQWWHPTLSLAFGAGAPQNVSVFANPTRGTGCYKTPGNCRGGDKHVGYDGQGAKICCPGRAGPVVRNPPQPPTAYDRCVAECYDAKNPGACIKKYCAWLKGIEPPGSGSSPQQELRRTRRVIASATRRRRANNGSCCESCANGGQCEGGCGGNCTCGKEGPLANRGGRLSAATSTRAPQGCWVKGRYVIPCPTPQLTAPQSGRAPGCWVKDCPECKPRYQVPCPTPVMNAAQSSGGRPRRCWWESIPGYPGKSLCCDYPGASGNAICLSRTPRR